MRRVKPLWCDRRASMASRLPLIDFRVRRGARAVEWDGLENRCGRKPTEGSNPSLSAKFNDLRDGGDSPESRFFQLANILLTSPRSGPMSKGWQNKTDGEPLNFDGSQTGLIAQYERIMAKKTIDALMEVRAGLFDVKRAMHFVTDQLDSRLKELQKAQDDAAKSQGKLQRVAIWLTVVIALSTVVYTWITWQSVQVQREANQIQREAQSSR